MRVFTRVCLCVGEKAIRREKVLGPHDSATKVLSPHDSEKRCLVLTIQRLVRTKHQEKVLSPHDSAVLWRHTRMMEQHNRMMEQHNRMMEQLLRDVEEPKRAMKQVHATPSRKQRQREGQTERERHRKTDAADLEEHVHEFRV